ncbi:MAG: spore germination protein [Bacilli bacterium]|nr:spore germination protein [Bacilli bacterium]
MNKIINKIKNETNNLDNVIYRKKRILYKDLHIIYIDALIASDKISDFVLRSLNRIHIPTYKNIINKIANFKYKELTTYDEIIYYLNSGFTILLVSKNKYIALETRRDLSRGVSTPITENTSRGPLDAFTENIEMNIGLIKRRIKSNDLWIKKYVLGKYTQTSAGLIYIKSIANKDLVEKVDTLIKNIDIDGIIGTGTIRNLIEKENKNFFPNILSAEKPYTAIKYLLQGNVIIMIDNDPFVLILPSTLNDYFISEEDDYNKSISVSVTRIVRYITFAITLLTPGIYIAITTYNQEILPTQLLTSIAAQRENVPFSTFVEALLMILSFEILRESDLKLPSFASSAISIVGALILGEAAVSAGIVSPIMIIVVAITSISSLIFVEPQFTNALRIYRIGFMIGGVIFGIYGILLMAILLLINLVSYDFLGIPYLSPFAPPITADLKDSIIKFPTIKLKKRNHLLSNNITKNITGDEYD